MSENPYKMVSKHIYFDNAASTPLRREVIAQMQKSLELCANPSATHSFGRSAKALIEKARKNIAKGLNVNASEIIFTSGGTEANNMILRGAVHNLGITQIVTSEQEHPSVLHTLQVLENEYNVRISFVKITSNGNIDLLHLEKILSGFSEKDRILVSLMYINNETGVIFPIEKVGEMCKKYKAFFHSDMVQVVGHYPLNLSELSVDFISASAHKFHGPKGVGFAFIRKEIPLKPLIVGGEQERGYRSGTEALHNIAGLDEAFTLAYRNLEKEQHYIAQLKHYFIAEIMREIPNVRFNAEGNLPEKTASHIVNIGLPTDEKKSQMALLYLDMKGIACSKGSACQSGSQRPSEVLKTFLSEEELKQTNFRFSFSIFNTKEEIDEAIKILKEFVTKE